MTVEELPVEGFERVVVDRAPGGALRSVIAVHDTTLGPALGGVRMRPYDNEEAAVAECLALARAMTLKAAATGLELGGGWSVIPGDVSAKTPELLLAHGRAIASLAGRFIPVNDVGTDQDDLRKIGEVAAPVCAQGDPSPWTALGVAAGILACARHLGHTELTGLRVGVQGAGHVGSALVHLLAEAGAEVLVSDVVAERAETVAESVGAEVVDPGALLTRELDVLAPCALGGVVTPASVGELRCRVIAGGANNVLASTRLAEDLLARGIVYAPDFCVNAGGAIFLQEQLLGHDHEAIRRRVLTVGEVITDLLTHATTDGIPTTQAAHDLANARLAKAAAAD
ncbi:Glu/Leu/Phe/Val dehydrogenase family protein [Amycolatopsis magusensis]|uniref:Leucine dehydrogenase n=1 Tax=Amycolatopsis magusensis TaxID=882444 RepID=A0ABS4PY29_9PSEU|nr:Glu/Leu/Phe/Val dehydrogenase [Amycolatopsis magusensis]MBP2184334.1 leucine dehydrogenase [Amycolatopsis magusensis]